MVNECEWWIPWVARRCRSAAGVTAKAGVWTALVRSLAPPVLTAFHFAKGTVLTSPPERYHMPPERHHIKQLDQLQLSLDQRSRPRNLYLTSMMPMQLYRRRIASRRLVSRGSGPSLTTTLLYRNPWRFSLTTTFRTWNPRQHRTPLLSTTTQVTLQPNIHPPQVQHLTARFLCPPMPPLVQRPFAGAKSPATSLVVISPVPMRSKSYGAKTSSPPPLDTPEQSMSRNTHGSYAHTRTRRHSKESPYRP